MSQTRTPEPPVGPAGAYDAGAAPVPRLPAVDAPPSGFLWPEDRPEGPLPPPAAPVRSWQDWFVIAFAVTGVLLSAWIYLAPVPAGLTPQGKAACSVFVLCTTLWVTNVIPFGITGLFALALLGLAGAMTPSEAFAAAGNAAVFFILGVFIIAAALVKTGLSKRWALLFLIRFERSPYVFATGMMLTSALATVFMPAQATVAMLFPIAFEVAQAMRLRKGDSTYGKVLFLALAWGAMVGSNASFLGSTRAALALGMLHDAHGITVTFTQWFIASLPLVLLGILMIPLIIRVSFRKEQVDFRGARAVLEGAVQELGPIRWPQTKVALLMLGTVLAWIFLAGMVDLAIIALLAASAMFFSGALTWDDLDGRIYWNVILMYCGAIALGVALDRTGAAEWVVTSALGDLDIPPLLAVAGLAIATLFVSEFMSNAAAVAVMLPLGFTIGEQIGIPPTAIMLATTFGAGLDFALPISSAPNTIAFASGYLKMTDFLRAGALMTLASIISMILVAMLWWPLIGIL
ncbi:MAG: DASS family sodium-coupled anion symporter [Gemmatimonadota bacterium]|nr:DASS family sodium-coupled anion symporter [Gemmatimonadota bacterium]